MTVEFSDGVIERMELPVMEMVRTVSRPVWQDEEVMFWICHVEKSIRHLSRDIE